MRLLVISDLWVPFPGGAERLMFNIAKHLNWNVYVDVVVLTGYLAARQLNGPPLAIRHDISVGEHRDEGAVVLASEIERLAPDVILTHHFYARTFADVLDASRVPYVEVVHNGQRLPGAALAVYNSRFVADQQEARQPQDLVLNPFAFGDVAAERHEHAIGFVKPIEHKGVRLVYDIADRMPERRFVILRGEWQDMEIIEPRPNVTFVEPVVDIRDFYAQVDLMLMPSRSEDAGTIAQEATMNGLPCISSNVGGLPETNGGGILLDPDDVDAWVTAIRDMDDPATRSNRVDAQRHAAHDWQATLGRLETAIANLAFLGPGGF